jgi:phosphonate transport system substrate-binding protein
MRQVWTRWTGWTRWTTQLILFGISCSFTISCTNTQISQQAETTVESRPIETACAPAIQTIDFGILSTESQANLKPKVQPLIVAMEAKLGRRINAFYATDYAALIEAMGAGQLQLAWYGGKSYIEAEKRANAQAFARVINADGTKDYVAYLITNKDNPILADIDISTGNGDQYVIQNASRLTFAFNDPESTSGYLVPMYYIFAENNVDPTRVFKEIIFAGSHEATALAIANNQVDIATNNSENMALLQQSSPADFNKIQVIWTSPKIPKDPLAYRKDLPDCLKQQLKTFFYEYKDAAILKPLGWSGFEPAEDQDWNAIRELDIAKEILETQNNKFLQPADRKAKIDQLNQQLEELRKG